MRNRCRQWVFERGTRQARATQMWRALGYSRNAATLPSENTGDESRLTRHGGLILGIGQKNALLGGKPHREHGNVSQRTDNRGNPCGMNQRQRKHFRENGGVIRMAHIPEWA